MGLPRFPSLLYRLAVTLCGTRVTGGPPGTPLRPGRAAFHDPGAWRADVTRFAPGSWKTRVLTWLRAPENVVPAVLEAGQASPDLGGQRGIHLAHPQARPRPEVPRDRGHRGGEDAPGH